MYVPALSEHFFLTPKKKNNSGTQPFFFNKMITAVWGDICWDYCFLVCLSYADNPNQDQQNSMSQFFTYLVQTLPCPSCSNHAQAYILKNPPRVESKTAMVEWLVAFHNMVNIGTGKDGNWTVNEATAALMKRMAQKIVAKNKTALAAKNNGNDDNGENIIVNNNNDADSSSSNETLYFGFMIAFVILFGIFLIAFIVVALQKRRLTKQLQTYQRSSKMGI